MKKKPPLSPILAALVLCGCAHAPKAVEPQISPNTSVRWIPNPTLPMDEEPAKDEKVRKIRKLLQKIRGDSI